MRKTLLSLVVAGSLVAVTPPAHAATWFGPGIASPIDNAMGPGPAPRPAATADVDSDGRADLVSVGDFTAGDIRVSLGDGTGRFAAATEVAGTAQTQGLDLGDLTGDGRADIVAMTTSEARILKGDGAGGFTQIGAYPLTLGGQVQPLVVDVDGDGDLDVVAPTFTAVQSLVNGGAGSFTAGPTTQVPGAGALSAIAVARLDPGSTPDLFAIDGMTGTAFALTGNGDGGFTVRGSLYATSFVPEDIAAIDLNGDGYDDAAVVGSFSFSLATGLTDGTGRFTSPVPQSSQFGGPGPTSAAVADFDEDGREDLVVSSLADPTAGTLTVLAGNGTPGMQKIGTFSTAAFPQNPVLADYDQDGDTDIAVVSPGTITVLPNTTP
ncbi:FG-GAP repeat domain-containing protein [Nocardioides antri]|uniref:VCBS repeat-containing protein n=1 Tax=Nocardioides antri TaxID=2607659 RepID=A0A5B1M4G5_9ACTN|nr:VCBS repeat-containing protein [Nocardioides antri]KAA1426677.1 VCBS repeat-containing protein [Nocardioides antri]